MGFFNDIWKGVKNVGKSIGNVITDIPSTLLGGAIDLGSDWLQNELVAKPNTDEAWERSKEASALAFKRSYGAYKHRYRDTMKDMRKAGLNPILAAGSAGFTTSGQPAYTPPQSMLAQPQGLSAAKSYSDWTQGQSNVESKKNIHADTRKKLVESQKIRKEINETISNTLLNRQKTKESKANEKETIKNIALLDKKIWESIAGFHKTIQEAYLALDKQTLTKEQVKNLQSERGKIHEQTKTLQAQLAMLTKIANVYNGPSGQMMANVKTVMDALNLNFAAIVGGLK